MGDNQRKAHVPQHWRVLQPLKASPVPAIRVQLQCERQARPLEAKAILMHRKTLAVLIAVLALTPAGASAKPKIKTTNCGSMSLPNQAGIEHADRIRVRGRISCWSARAKIYGELKVDCWIFDEGPNYPVVLWDFFQPKRPLFDSRRWVCTDWEDRSKVAFILDGKPVYAVGNSCASKGVRVMWRAWGSY